MVGGAGLEPTTTRFQSAHSAIELPPEKIGIPAGTRTRFAAVKVRKLTHS